MLDALAAFVTAILAGTGIGGGGLFVIYLTAVRHLPQSDAQALNLVFFIAAGVAALPYHVKSRHLNFRFIIPCIILGCIGTLLGGELRRSFPEETVRVFFGFLLIFVGFRSLFSKKYDQIATSSPTQSK